MSQTPLLTRQDLYVDRIIAAENKYGVDAPQVEEEMDNLIAFEEAFANQLRAEHRRLAELRLEKRQRFNRRLQKWSRKLLPKKLQPAL